MSGQFVIPFARRVESANGDFSGVALVNILPETFSDFHRSLDLGPSGHVTLQRGDGLILARYPHHPEAIGTTVDNATIFPDIAMGMRDGVASTISPVDGVTRITSFRRIPGFDLLVVVGVGRDAVLADCSAPAFLPPFWIADGGTGSRGKPSASRRNSSSRSWSHCPACSM
ncbi:MAG: hypothetical protein H7841_01775 [Magnetospirillum sp. WYHS-4]